MGILACVLKRTVDRVCDLCGSDKGVRRYRIEYLVEPTRRTTDLCARHQKPLEEIRDKVPPKGGPRSGLREREVTSVHTVRKMRTAAKKKPKDK